MKIDEFTEIEQCTDGSVFLKILPLGRRFTLQELEDYCSYMRTISKYQNM